MAIRWAIREKLAMLCESQNWRCCYCGVQMLISPRSHDHAASFDEVIPRTLGGTTNWENQVAACRGCNSARGHQDAEAFYWAVQYGTGLGKGRLAAAKNKPIREKPGNRKARGKPPVKFSADQCEAVPMSSARAAYFQMVYGFIP